MGQKYAIKWLFLNNCLREGAQIDLIIDRADRMVHLCEMKFSVGPYELKDAYEKKLRQRMTIFREAINAQKHW